MKEFLKFALKPHLKEIIAITILTIIQTIFQIRIIYYFDQSLDCVKKEHIPQLLTNGELMIVFTIILIICMALIVVLTNRVSSQIAYETRAKIFNILTNLPTKELNKFPQTGLMSRTTRGVFTEQGFIIVILRDLLPIPFVVIGVLVEIYFLHDIYAFILGGIILILTVALVFKLKQITELYFKAKKTYGRINFLFRDKVMGAKTIRIFQKQKFESEKFKEASEDSYDNSIVFQLNQYYIAPLLLIILNIIVVFLFWYLFEEYAIDNIFDHNQLTNFIVIIQYVLYMITILAPIPKVIENWPRSYATSIRIEEVLAIEDKIYETEDKKTKSEFKGIEFKNVSFNQDKRDIISNISFKIPEKSTVAIVGGNSSGKTSLMYLLDRLYDLTEGEILINGIDINDCTAKEVRSKISFAMQKNQILNDTIYNNITMGDSTITKEEIIAVCEKTGLNKLFENENFNLDSEISENGSNISKSFKEKISLTRALVHDRDIYIFDEFNYQMENKTNIILTKNIKEIINIDHIIVLKDGKLVGEGNHDELIGNCPEYKNLYIEGGLHAN